MEIKRIFSVYYIFGALLITSCGGEPLTKTTFYQSIDSVRTEIKESAAKRESFKFHKGVSKSLPVRIDTVKRMHKEYLTNYYAILSEDEENGDYRLRGFSIDTAHLRYLMKNLGAPMVYVSFGVHPDDWRKPDNEQRFTVIFSGLDGTIPDSAKIKVPGTGDYTPYFFDFCEPCPPACPKNIGDVTQ